MPESSISAGTVLAMSARDLLEFVRMHLATPAFDAMRDKHITHPDFGNGEWWWGLGWELSNYEGGREVIGHSGLTMGYTALLRVVPEAGVAVAVLTNGGKAVWPMYAEIFKHLLAELAGVRSREFASPPAEPIPVDAGKVIGIYRCASIDVHITAGEHGRVKVRNEGRNRFAKALLESAERDYTYLREDALIAVEKPHSVLVLIGRDEHDRVKWVHWGRAAGRV